MAFCARIYSAVLVHARGLALCGTRAAENPTANTQTAEKPVGPETEPVSAVAEAESVVREAKPKSKAKSKVKEPVAVA